MRARGLLLTVAAVGCVLGLENPPRPHDLRDGAPEATADATVDVDVPLDVPLDVPRDAPDARDAPDVLDVRDAVDARDALPADAPDVTVAPDVLDVLDVTVVPDVVDAPDVPDVLDAPCRAGTSSCAGRCVDLLSDPLHCGRCGAACDRTNGTPACVGGACAIRCHTGFVNCNGRVDDGCEASLASVEHCGGCGNRCAAFQGTPACVAGACATTACAAPFADCDRSPANGCEVDLDADPDHCGACGRRCPAGFVCASGACACPVGEESCGGVCRDLQRSSGHCGRCDRPCTSGVCARGVCGGSCPAADTLCDGVCRNTATDPRHCGGCGRGCSNNHVAATCSAGNCGGRCLAGWADCNGGFRADGCEADTLTDPLHCGGCGRACSNHHVPSPSCASGACVGACAPGWADCNADRRADGCEVDTATTPAHCGGCGRACSTNHITPRCSNGACGGACAPGFYDCNGNLREDGCESSAPCG